MGLPDLVNMSGRSLDYVFAFLKAFDSSPSKALTPRLAIVIVSRDMIRLDT